MRIKITIFLLIICFLGGCLPPKRLPPPLEFIPPKKWPELSRPTDVKAFKSALRCSLNYYRRLPPNHIIPGTNISYRVEELIEGLEIFELCLENVAWQKCLKAHFDMYQAGGGKKVLFTGYYQPILYGNLSPTKRYRYPIYRRPDELVKINLSRFGKDLPHLVLKGMLKGNEIVPFYTRLEIDFFKKLAEKGYEIVWVDDPVELFFLHIQGSGLIILPNGEKLYLHYAISNGHPYRSIGQSMKGLGLLDAANGLEIKEYLRTHPEKMETILSLNPSYIFFDIRDRGPLGALEEVLTPFYSIATDPSIFPRGSLLFIETQLPLLDSNKTLASWSPFRSFALNQDSGGAIKGSSRADIFLGTGEVAEAQACYMAEYGKLYLLIKKK
jgi:membrane-bound lytic murein transglycosylase A